jgi:hypothetical protein
MKTTLGDINSVLGARCTATDVLGYIAPGADEKILMITPIEGRDPVEYNQEIIVAHLIRGVARACFLYLALTYCAKFVSAWNLVVGLGKVSYGNIHFQDQSSEHVIDGWKQVGIAVYDLAASYLVTVSFVLPIIPTIFVFYPDGVKKINDYFVESIQKGKEGPLYVDYTHLSGKSAKDVSGEATEGAKTLFRRLSGLLHGFSPVKS